LKKRSCKATTCIEVFGEGVRFPCRGLARKCIEKIASDAAGLIPLDDTLVTLVIARDDYIRNMNRRFRGLDEPTDVLSFPGGDGDVPFSPVGSPRKQAGEIYLSLDRAAKQAEEYGVSLAGEVVRLIVHGMLHLAGYDHERSGREKARMERKEEEILSKMTRLS
jgi:probable rRNA maturation factor